MTKRILVIDDDEDILGILSIIFEEEGYEVILCNTGTTPEEVQLIHPDLVLLDVRIKGFYKTGDEICSDLKRVSGTQNIPVILLSAESDVPFRARKSGANAYVRKPFNVEQLVSQVKQILA